MPLAPRKSIAPCPEEPQVPSESQRFESSFCGLSRVNDSLMQINLVQRRIGTANCPQNYRQDESETRTRPNLQIRYASGGSAWLMTRFTVGKARRSARSISS